jgi:magnesium-transporting ATPase (P-type)
MSEQTPTIEQVPQRSTFVTVLAWIFIVMAGIGTFISILQNIMLYKMFPREEMNKAMQQPDLVDQMPTFAQFMFSHIELFFLAFLIVVTVTFISAIALLKRKNWARIVFIVIMSLGIMWNIFGVIMQYIMFSSLPTEIIPPPEFESMMTIMKIASLIMATAFCVLFGWIIKKLSSAKIKAEFV